MKKLLITTLSLFILLINTVPVAYSQFQYYDNYNTPNNYQQYQSPNYYYQYSGPPTAQAMKQLNEIMKQFFSQDYFSGGEFMDEDFSFNIPQQSFPLQIPGMPNSLTPQMPGNQNSFTQQIPNIEQAPSYKDSPNIYY